MRRGRVELISVSACFCDGLGAASMRNLQVICIRDSHMDCAVPYWRLYLPAWKWYLSSPLVNPLCSVRAVRVDDSPPALAYTLAGEGLNEQNSSTTFGLDLGIARNYCEGCKALIKAFKLCQRA